MKMELDGWLICWISELNSRFGAEFNQFRNLQQQIKLSQPSTNQLHFSFGLLFISWNQSIALLFAQCRYSLIRLSFSSRGSFHSDFIIHSVFFQSFLFLISVWNLRISWLKEYWSQVMNQPAGVEKMFDLWIDSSLKSIQFNQTNLTRMNELK